MSNAATALRGVKVSPEQVISADFVQNMNVKMSNTITTETAESEQDKGDGLTEVPVYSSSTHVTLGQQLVYLTMLYTFISLATPDKDISDIEDIFKMQFGIVFKEDVGGSEISSKLAEHIELLQSSIEGSLGEMLQRSPVIDINDLCTFMDKWAVK